MILDPDDPTPPLREFRIYGDDMAQTWAVVDEIDYQWALQRLWHANAPHPTRNGKKRYFRSRAGWRTGDASYLHVGIMIRTGIIPPDKFHILVEHHDGDEWNCRRKNLGWATHKSNRATAGGKNKLRENVLSS